MHVLFWEKATLVFAPHCSYTRFHASGVAAQMTDSLYKNAEVISPFIAGVNE